MIKILFVTAFDLAGYSGSNVATRSLVQALGSRQDVELLLLAPAPSDGSDLDSELPVSHWEELPGRTRWLTWWHLATAIRVLRLLRRMLRAHEPNMVVVRHAAFFVPSAFLFPRRGVTLVLLVRGSLRVPLGATGPVGRLLEDLSRWVSFSIVARADRVLLAYREAIGKDGDKLRPERVRIVPNAADLSAFKIVSIENARKALAERVGQELIGRIVGFAGSLRPRHCLEELFEASAMLHEQGLTHRLLLVGDGPVRRKLEELASQLGIEPFVHFLGRVPHEEVGVCLGACNLLYGVVDPTNPSNPIKVYEGLAIGRPVVTSPSPELVFVREHGFGVLAESTDAPGIASAVEAGLTLPWTDEDALRARRYIATHHTWDAVAREVLRK